MSRKDIFFAIRDARGKGFAPDEVGMIDVLLDRLQVPRDEPEDSREVNESGLKLMHEFEGLSLRAYRDPGSRDGLPITIGRGSTKDEHGNPINLGDIWTEAQADAQFARDVAKFAAGVSKAIGEAPTTSNQFSAMVSLAYNIGLHAFSGSTLLKMHKAGDYAGAAGQFLRWNRNDGKVMGGLARRRAAEAALYGKRP